MVADGAAAAEDEADEPLRNRTGGHMHKAAASCSSTAAVAFAEHCRSDGYPILLSDNNDMTTMM